MKKKLSLGVVNALILLKRGNFLRETDEGWILHGEKLHGRTVTSLLNIPGLVSLVEPNGPWIRYRRYKLNSKWKFIGDWPR